MRPRSRSARSPTNRDAIARPAVAATTAVVDGHGRVLQTQPAQSGDASSWRRSRSRRRPRGSTRAAGRSTRSVDKFATSAPLDEQTNCLATAVYFEARGEMPRRSAGRRPCGDEPGCVGPLSARLVQRRQAAGAILVRPPRRVSAGRHELRRMAQGRGDCRARGREHRSERQTGRALVSRELCRSVVGSSPATWSRRSARTSSTARNRVNRRGEGVRSLGSGAFFVSARASSRSGV